MNEWINEYEFSVRFVFRWGLSSQIKYLLLYVRPVVLDNWIWTQDPSVNQQAPYR